MFAAIEVFFLQPITIIIHPVLEKTNNKEDALIIADMQFTVACLRQLECRFLRSFFFIVFYFRKETINVQKKNLSLYIYYCGKIFIHGTLREKSYRVRSEFLISVKKKKNQLKRE